MTHEQYGTFLFCKPGLQPQAAALWSLSKVVANTGKVLSHFTRVIAHHPVKPKSARGISGSVAVNRAYNFLEAVGPTLLFSPPTYLRLSTSDSFSLWLLQTLAQVSHSMHCSAHLQQTHMIVPSLLFLPDHIPHSCALCNGVNQPGNCNSRTETLIEALEVAEVHLVGSA